MLLYVVWHNMLGGRALDLELEQRMRSSGVELRSSGVEQRSSTA
jgi:hypothetical protein